MDLRIIVRPASSNSSIEELDDGRLRVSVRSKAKDGKANAEVRALLAEHFAVPTKDIRIVRGVTASAKTVWIASRGRESQNH
jgi:hypothetical protein